MILLIDNYDSFSYNLLPAHRPPWSRYRVVRNDAVTAEDVEKMDCEAIFLSPGRGARRTPASAWSIVSASPGKRPSSGLSGAPGHLAPPLERLWAMPRALCHGKVSEVPPTGQPALRRTDGAFLPVARLPLLAVEAATLPDCLRVTGTPPTARSWRGAPGIPRLRRSSSTQSR
jgi:anthranilate/para-aminobenzoate synthase component II